MENRKLRVSIFLLAVFFCLSLIGCSKQLSAYVSEAQDAYNSGDFEKANSIYTELISFTYDWRKCEKLGYPYDAEGAINDILEAYVKMEQDQNKQISFFKESLLSDSGDYIVQGNKNLIKFVINHESLAPDIRTGFFEFALSTINSNTGNSISFFDKNYLAETVTSSNLSSSEKSDLISEILKNEEVETYVEDYEYPNLRYFNTDYLFPVFNDLLAEFVITDELIFDPHNRSGHRFIYPADYTPEENPVKNVLHVYLLDKEIYPSADGFTINLQENYEYGKILPIDFLKKPSDENEKEIAISDLYYFLNENQQPSSVEQVDTIIFLKQAELFEADYITDSGTTLGVALRKATGIWVVDVSERELVEVKIFFGSEPPETISTTEDFDKRFGDDPIYDALHYILYNEMISENYLDFDLKTFCLEYM